MLMMMMKEELRHLHISVLVVLSAHIICGRAALSCLTSPCVYGICVETYNGSYTCYCMDGFTGANCQTNWDECWSSPCLHGGTCIDGVASFNCTCPDGFIGDTCQEDVNECISSPCQNNGTCVDVANGYTCICAPGYTGINCETDMAVCNTTEDARCTNGGACIEGPGISFTCRCLPGWRGGLCEKPTDECESSPCVNGGVCIDMHATYVCACPYGYTGKNCETRVELCGQNICENKALCVIESKTSVCYCVPDFHGERCQYRYDECQKGPGCLNGGSCVDGVDSYSCSCPRGLLGRFCECIATEGGNLNCNYIGVPLPQPRTEVPPSTTPLLPSTGPSRAPTELTVPTSSSSLSTTQYFTSTLTGIIETSPELEVTTEVTEPSIQVHSELSTYVITKETGDFSSTVVQSVETTIFDISTPQSTDTEFPVTYTYFSSSPISGYTTGPQPSDFTEETEFTSQTELELSTPPSSSASSTSTKRFTLLTPSSSGSPGVSSRTTVSMTTLGGELTTEEPLYITTETFLTEIETTGVMSTSDFEPPQESNCTQVVCANGGTCFEDTQGFSCQCTFGWKGKYCDEEEGIKVAAFKGRSYLFHILGNSTQVTISFKFRSLSDTGLLIYAYVPSNMYMSLFMQNGLLKFQFSCGIQTMLFSELKYPINTGFEIDISATLELLAKNGTQEKCAGAVRLNGTLSMNGKQDAYVSPLGVKSLGAFYLGGLPQHISNQVDVPVRTGITACMHTLRVNKFDRFIYSDALDGSEISECSSLACLSGPCYNGATCMEVNQTWHCLCSSGYTGLSCKESVCLNNPCKFGGTCVQYPGSGFLCLCPLGKHGMYCEQEIEIGQPQFSSSVEGLASYTAYPLPGAIHHSFELRFRFIPSSLDQVSLMVFIGQSQPHDSSSDHLAVSFIKGYVVLTWNLGSGPRRIFTPEAISAGQSGREVHTVRLGRAGQDGWLQVDSMANVTGTSPGYLSQLNTRPIIYIGGYESRNFSGLPHDLPLHSGFSGCLFDVELRSGRVRLAIQRSRDAVGRNVGQCSTKHCHNSTCSHSGMCIDHGATFTCLCQDGWFGPTCSLRYNPCDSTRHNCSQGATCVPAGSSYECDCPLGTTGKYCQNAEVLSDVGFSGVRSYLSLAPASFDQTESCIDFELRPVSAHGLVLFSSQTQGLMRTFLSLTLHGAVLELRVLPIGGQRNGDVLTVRSGKVLLLGEWTRVRAGRYGRRIFLWVDGSVNAGNLLPGEIILPSHSPLYIGGVPDLSEVPVEAVARPPVSLAGCVRRLWLHWTPLPLDSEHILGARNLHDCDGTACGGDVCFNGGSCWLSQDNLPNCKCPPQYMGARCERQASCEEVGCEHAGRCINIHNQTVRCSCPAGWTGPFCNVEVPRGTPHFGGDSYLMVDTVHGLTKRGDKEGIASYSPPLIHHLYLNMTTAHDNGMLLWTSNEEQYLGVGLESGLLKAVWGRKHSQEGQTVLVGGSLLSDGVWHSLVITTNTTHINFLIDNALSYSYSNGLPLLTNGLFYLGGFPRKKEVFLATDGHFQVKFNGCIKELALNKQISIVDFSKYSGENLGSCDLLFPPNDIIIRR